MSSVIDRLRMAQATQDPVEAAKALKEAGVIETGDAEKEAAADGVTTSDLITVIFQKKWKRYYAGDRAGFQKRVADRLVEGGAAKYAGSFLEKVANGIKALSPKEMKAAAKEKKADAKAAAEKAKKVEADAKAKNKRAHDEAVANAAAKQAQKDDAAAADAAANPPDDGILR